MKKQYFSPRCQFHKVRAASVIGTSDIPIGEDVDQGKAEAPRCSGSDWSDYNS